ncbi:MAG TPA: zinc permease, partial [Mycobacteriales bacterium]|nr:zinc permease [Mycobacteriales bacterium]
MSEAVIFGLVASSALVLGAVLGARVRMPKRFLAVMLSFAAGALMTALAFELFEDSYQRGGVWRAAAGLLIGATVFTVLSAGLDRLAEGRVPEDHGSEKLDPDAAASDAAASPASTTGTAGLALLAAVTLDGVPENVALGVSLTEGTGGLALLAAIFVSNLPESLVGSASMR